ncbi:hypothetical protein ABKN59_008924 [Abortiporus biennis]
MVCRICSESSLRPSTAAPLSGDIARKVILKWDALKAGFIRQSGDSNRTCKKTYASRAAQSADFVTLLNGFEFASPLSPVIVRGRQFLLPPYLNDAAAVWKNPCAERVASNPHRKFKKAAQYYNAIHLTLRT